MALTNDIKYNKGDINYINIYEYGHEHSLSRWVNKKCLWNDGSFRVSFIKRKINGVYLSKKKSEMESTRYIQRKKRVKCWHDFFCVCKHFTAHLFNIRKLN